MQNLISTLSPPPPKYHHHRPSSSSSSSSSSTMSKPTLVFIPGLWEGPTVFSDVIHILQTQHNYPTLVLPLISTGTNGPTAKTYTDDVASIRSAVQDLVDNQGKELLLMMHSAGAFTGSDAIKDLGLPFRTSHGLAGGVRKLVYLSGALLPEYSDHPPIPFIQTTVFLST